MIVPSGDPIAIGKSHSRSAVLPPSRLGRQIDGKVTPPNAAHVPIHGQAVDVPCIRGKAAIAIANEEDGFPARSANLSETNAGDCTPKGSLSKTPIQGCRRILGSIISDRT